MKEIPSKMSSVTSIVLHALIIPVWIVLFYLLYQPDWACSWLDMGAENAVERLTFNLLMIMCIVLGILVASRTVMILFRKWIPLAWIRYVAWIVCEWAAMSLFVGMYMALMYKGQYMYFEAVGRSAVILIGSMFYPYAIIELSLALLGVIDEPQRDEDDLIRLYDNTKRLKLVIAANSILYIEADENYVIIKYTEGERIKEYTLRNSMKSLEEIMQKHGIVRCQRSYYVNPNRVKVLRKDKEGMIVAELDTADVKPIRVSPKYYALLSERL